MKGVRTFVLRLQIKLLYTRTCLEFRRVKCLLLKLYSLLFTVWSTTGDSRTFLDQLRKECEPVWWPFDTKRWYLRVPFLWRKRRENEVLKHLNISSNGRHRYFYQVINLQFKFRFSTSTDGLECVENLVCVVFELHLCHEEVGSGGPVILLDLVPFLFLFFPLSSFCLLRGDFLPFCARIRSIRLFGYLFYVTTSVWSKHKSLSLSPPHLQGRVLHLLTGRHSNFVVRLDIGWILLHKVILFYTTTDSQVGRERAGCRNKGLDLPVDWFTSPTVLTSHSSHLRLSFYSHDSYGLGPTLFWLTEDDSGNFPVVMTVGRSVDPYPVPCVVNPFPTFFLLESRTVQGLKRGVSSRLKIDIWNSYISYDPVLRVRSSLGTNHIRTRVIPMGGPKGRRSRKGWVISYSGLNLRVCTETKKRPLRIWITPYDE